MAPVVVAGSKQGTGRNGLRCLVRYGAAWRAMPIDLPPWHALYGQAPHWLWTGCFEMPVHDLRAVLRLAEGR
jgi:transposase